MLCYVGKEVAEKKMTTGHRKVWEQKSVFIKIQERQQEITNEQTQKCKNTDRSAQSSFFFFFFLCGVCVTELFWCKNPIKDKTHEVSESLNVETSYLYATKIEFIKSKTVNNKQNSKMKHGEDTSSFTSNLSTLISHQNHTKQSEYISHWWAS